MLSFSMLRSHFLYIARHHYSIRLVQPKEREPRTSCLPMPAFDVGAVRPRRAIGYPQATRIPGMMRDPAPLLPTESVLEFCSALVSSRHMRVTTDSL